MDLYFSRPEVSNSDLSALKKYLSGDTEPIPIEAYRFGTLVDAMITEPDRVNFYSCTCDGDLYSPSDFHRAEKMRNAFLGDPLCRQLIQGSEMQKVMSVSDMPLHFAGIDYMLPVRCKWDIWNSSLAWGGDIKSTTATTLQQFITACHFFDYDRQRAWYMDIAGSSQDILIGISKVNFKVFKFPIRRGDNFYTSGRDKYLELSFKYWLLFS